MKKVETVNGYDIYELTKKECEERWLEYPTFAVVFEGETCEPYTEETTESSLEAARTWCEHFGKA